MKISIITASYNSAKMLRNAIESVLNQSYQNIEYLIIDGDSTDESVEIIQSYEVKFNGKLRWISEPDKGIYDALNKGILLASGDIIGVLHSDDVFASNDSLWHVHEAFTRSAADVVYGDLVYVKQSNPSQVIRYWRSNPFTPSLLFRGWMPPHPTVFVTKEMYQKHGLFDPAFSISADYDLLLRIFRDPLLHGVYLPEVITRMTLGGMSNRNLSNILIKSKEDYRALRKNGFPHAWWILLMKNLSKLTQFIH
ncbi:MAG: glycosyltransferase family 2 protein [Microbacter sp.]